VVADEARLVAKAICAVVTVVDPQLVVLGGGIGQAPGFADMVSAELRGMAPVVPDIRVSARGTDSVVDGCMAAGADLAWQRLVAALPGLPPDGALPDGAVPASTVPASTVPASTVPASADG
jgi:predicted NBD/HSP70 family sugar kinase